MNRLLRNIKGYKVSLESCGLHPLSGSVVMQGITVCKKTTSAQSQPFAFINKITLTVKWRKLLSGSLAADIDVTKPRLEMDIPIWKRDPLRPDPERRKTSAQSWQQKIRKALPFKINQFTVRGGDIHFRNLPGQGTDELQLINVHMQFQNRANGKAANSVSFSTGQVSAQFTSTGTLAGHFRGRPLDEKPTFETSFQLNDVDLKEFKSFFRHHLGTNIHAGVLGVFGEIAAAEGKVKGYVKPLIDHLDIGPVKHEGLGLRAKALVAQIAAKIFRNSYADRIATKINFEGSFENPDVNVLGVVGNFIKNAFSTAFAPRLDHQIFLGHRSHPKTIEISYPEPKPTKPHPVYNLLKKTFSHWTGDRKKILLKPT